MKRLLAVLLIGLVAACGPSDTGVDIEPLADPAEGAPEPQLPVTVTSADGRQVTVTDVSRILPLRGNISEIVFALGLGDRVVGRDISATASEVEGLPLVTRAHDVTAESVLSLRPTVILADTDTGPPEALDQIRNVGIPVIVFDAPTRVADIGSRIVDVASALGVADIGADVAERTAGAIEEVTSEIHPDERPVVAFLYVRGQAAVYLLGGPGSGADSMIEAAGGIDAGTEQGLSNPFTPLTSEALIAAGPEIILLTTTGLDSVGGIDGFLKIPGIAQTPAGMNRNIITVEDGALFSFGVRTPDAVAHLAEQLGEIES